MTSSRRPKIVIYVSKLLVQVPMNRLDPEKFLELLVTLSKAIYNIPEAQNFAMWRTGAKVGGARTK